MSLSTTKLEKCVMVKKDDNVIERGTLMATTDNGYRRCNEHEPPDGSCLQNGNYLRVLQKYCKSETHYSRRYSHA